MAEEHSKEIEHPRRADRVLLSFIFALLLLVSPLLLLWAGPLSPWYTPFVLWAVIIMLAFILERARA